MILKDGQEFSIPKTGPMSYDELEKKFADFFKKGNPIIIAFDPSLAKTAYPEGSREPIQRYPSKMHISRKSRVMYNGETSTFVLAKKYKRDKHGEFVLSDLPIAVNRGMPLTKENTDKETLWYLWFCAEGINNNANPINQSYCKLSFVNPLEDQRSEIEWMSLVAKVNAFLLDREKCDENTVHKFVRVLLSVNPEDMEDVTLRHMLATRVSEDYAFAEQALELIENADSTGVELYSITRALFDRGILKRAKGNIVWVHAEGDPEKVVTVSPNQKDDERVAAFIATDEAWQERFLEAYNQ